MRPCSSNGKERNFKTSSTPSVTIYIETSARIQLQGGMRVLRSKLPDWQVSMSSIEHVSSYVNVLVFKAIK